MDKEKIVHDLAVVAAAVTTYYNKSEIDKIENPSERMDFIAADVAMRYKQCRDTIEKCYLNGDII